MSQFVINEKNFARFAKRLAKIFEEKTNGKKLGYLESQELLSKIFGTQDLHEFKKLIQEKKSDLNTKEDPFKNFDPFAPIDFELNENFFKQLSITNSKSIKKPIRSPYKKYKHLNEAWHNPSHGIDINNKEELNLLFTDINKSEAMWKETGIHLGVIFQAVEQGNVIDMGCPIGLILSPEEYTNQFEEQNLHQHLHMNSNDIQEKVESEEDLNFDDINREESMWDQIKGDLNHSRNMFEGQHVHIKISDIQDTIEVYKKYLTNEVVENLDNIKIEIKPFYAIDQEKINYQVVEQNFNKRLKIK